MKVNAARLPFTARLGAKFYILKTYLNPRTKILENNSLAVLRCGCISSLFLFYIFIFTHFLPQGDNTYLSYCICREAEISLFGQEVYQNYKTFPSLFISRIYGEVFCSPQRELRTMLTDNSHKG